MRDLDHLRQLTGICAWLGGPIRNFLEEIRPAGLDPPDHPLDLGPGVAPQQCLAVEGRRGREHLSERAARQPSLIIELLLGDCRRIGILGRGLVIAPSGLGLLVAPGPTVGPLGALTVCAIFVSMAIRILARSIPAGLGRLGQVGLDELRR
jgi:hypothetical protein